MLSQRLVPSVALVLLLSLGAGSAGATNCAALTTKQPGDLQNHFFVLTFFGGMPVGVQPDARKAELESLAARFKNAIVDAYDSIASQVRDEIVPELNVLTCDYALGDGDFSRPDLDIFLRMNAIDVIWHGQEGAGPSIVYLSLPRYKRVAGTTRRRAEVASLVGAPTGRSEEDLAVELSRPDVTQRTMLALSVGLMSMEGTSDDPARLKLAKLSLCQAGANLAHLPSEVVRPVASALADDLKQIVKDALAEVDQRARNIGLNVVTTQPYKLACQPL
jgi:hypothetical protein